MITNGLQSFGLHRQDDAANELNQISADVNFRGFGAEAKNEVKPEAIARQYLERSLASKNNVLAEFSVTNTDSKDKITFEPVQTEHLPLTGNKLIKFRQRINDVSVYGTTANIELDKDNNFVSINSSIAPKLTSSGNAAIAPDQAVRIAIEGLKQEISVSITPLLYYYFFNGQWKLIYFLKDILLSDSNQKKSGADGLIHNHSNAPTIVNVVIDAHSGQILEITPAIMGLRTTESSADENGVQQTFFSTNINGTAELIDDQLNVYTYENEFQHFSFAPVQVVRKDATGWSSAAVSAHVNACRVVGFIRDILMRNSIDGNGMKVISSINCSQSAASKEWGNAAWIPLKQHMVYGQKFSRGKLRSYASSLDVVAHEIFHGVTQHTSKLEYFGESGALNESFSDIFGIIISNISNQNVNSWNWELGEEINGTPIRSFKQPSLFNQPEHMNMFEEGGDVHTNSGIHNKAAYLVLTAQNHDGSLIFAPHQVAQLYYLALVRLAEKSTFSDSYLSIKLAAKSMFPNDRDLRIKLVALERSFQEVGII